MKKLEVSDIWTAYEKGRDHHTQKGLYRKGTVCHRFYEGDQWHGVEKSGERLPRLNFIMPTVDYKVSMVAKNNMRILYSPMNRERFEEMQEVCETLNAFAAKIWELRKMDTLAWEIIKEAAVTGDSYAYFYDDQLNVQTIDRTNVYLGDEQEREIQNQPYIIIRERRRVEDVRKDAEQYGIGKDKLELIVSEEDDAEDAEDITEVDTKTGKCTSLLYLYKDEEGIVHILRAVKTLIYQPDTVIRGKESGDPGLKLYPMAQLVWTPQHKSSRGVGEVWEKIPNQIEVNKILMRRAVNNKMTGFPKPVVNVSLVQNPEDVDKVGAVVKFKGQNLQAVKDAFTYVSPAQMNGEAAALQNEMVSQTRELAGAGEAATGQIDPTKASGAAIIAVQDQAAIPLNEPMEYYKQFVEDIASIWWGMWVAYNPEGMTVSYEENGEIISAEIAAEDLQRMRVNIRIDVSPATPVSKYAREQALENALAAQYISFEEYVEALPDDANAPKAAFAKILDKRAAAQRAMAQGIPGMGEAMPGMEQAPQQAAQAGIEGVAELAEELAGMDPEIAMQALRQMELPEEMKQMVVQTMDGGMAIG